MMHKLGLRNTAAVTRYAMDNGLLAAVPKRGNCTRPGLPLKTRSNPIFYPAAHVGAKVAKNGGLPFPVHILVTSPSS